ncbi:MAG: hypothetical protein ACREIC_02610, partial [Limisphaerales bacterium]
ATTSRDTSFLRRFAGHIEPPATPTQTTLHFAVSAGLIHFAWAGSPTVRLQSTTRLNPASWVDLAGTLGASTASVPLAGPAAFFRLAE